MEPKIRKPVSNLRKLKHIEKAVQRDWKNREKIRADGLRELGFYSSPVLGPWVNPVGNLYSPSSLQRECAAAIIPEA